MVNCKIENLSFYFITLTKHYIVTSKFSLIDYALWGMFFIWLIIDSITGFFIFIGHNIPLSQLFKLFIIFLIIVRLHKNKSNFCFFYLLLFYIVWYFLHLALINENFTNAVSILLKFLSIVFLYLYFRFCVINFQDKTIINARKTLVIAWIIVAFNVVLGLLGYGIPSYGENEKDMGVKGFFYAGNELGGIMAVIVPFIVYLVKVRLSGYKTAVAYIIITLIGVLIGTKSCILVTLLSVFIVPLLYTSTKNRLRILLCFVIIIIALISIISPFFDTISISAIDRWTYFYNTGGLTQLIFSGRDEFWEMKKEAFFYSPFFTQMFGMGVEGKAVERDHLDSLISFGYIGLFAVLLFFFYLLFVAIKSRKNNSLMKVVIFSDLLVLGIGYMAGHVWYSAMASIYIALFNSFSFVKYKGFLYGKIDKQQEIK